VHPRFATHLLLWVAASIFAIVSYFSLQYCAFFAGFFVDLFDGSGGIFHDIRPIISVVVFVAIGLFLTPPFIVSAVFLWFVRDAMSTAGQRVFSLPYLAALLALSIFIWFLTLPVVDFVGDFAQTFTYMVDRSYHTVYLMLAAYLLAGPAMFRLILSGNRIDKDTSNQVNNRSTEV
jgi:hypothetical protein